MSFKFIHEFSIATEREIDKTESREENGATVTTTTKVKESTPHFFCFKKPSRVERENAEEYRAQQWGEYVKRGVLPTALLLKTYANGGGTFNDAQKADYHQLQETYVLKSQEYQLAVVQKEAGKASVALKELLLLREQIVELERSQSDFYENTAEAKAKFKMTEWLLLHLSYHRASPEAAWEPYFKGADLAAKLDNLDSLEESNDETYQKARSELTTVASIAALFIMGGGVLTKESVEAFVKEIANPVA